MREKALIGDDGSQVRRKGLLAVMRTNLERLEPMPFRTQLKAGCEGEWSAFDPLPKLTQASDKDVRIIVGKERESYEPELNYTEYTGEWSHPI